MLRRANAYYLLVAFVVLGIAGAQIKMYMRGKANDDRLVAIARQEKINEAKVVTVTDTVNVRVKNTIAKLRAESFEDSLECLGAPSLYDWPGPPGEPPILLASRITELQHQYSRVTVNQILSNRRVLKVRSELAGLSTEKRRESLRSALRKHHSYYRKQWEQYLATGAQDVYVHDFMQVSRGSFKIGSCETTEPGIWGSRLATLAMVLLCGESGISDLRNDVLDVAHAASKDYQMLLDLGKGYSGIKTLWIRTEVSLYDPVVFASSIISLSSNAGSSALSSIMKERSVAGFDAALTEFDITARNKVMPVDMSHPVIFHILEQVDDGEFEGLLAE